jgi:hypothetical protein
MSKSDESGWIKIDLHIHTLDDPKDAVDFSAHQLLERARSLGFRVLAITLHDAVFDRKEVFADAAAMGILLIPAAEVRLLGSDVILLNVTAEEVAQLKNFDDVRRLRHAEGILFSLSRRTRSTFRRLNRIAGFSKRSIVLTRLSFVIFTLAHSIRIARAQRVATRFGKPMIATSDAHRLHAFGCHYTSMPMPPALTIENVLAGLRTGPLRLTSPSSSLKDFLSAVYFVFLAHPFRVRRKMAAS